MDNTQLPPLPLEEWEATKDTLHLWTQIVGKTRLALMPMRNHWWNVTLYPSARGLTTRRMPVEAHNLEIEIDLVDHRLGARTTESEAGFELRDGLSVADFHRHLTDPLNALDVSVDIRNSTGKWIKSSRCGPQANTNCVELSRDTIGVAIRDTKTGGAILRFGDAPWLAFLEHCRTGR